MRFLLSAVLAGGIIGQAAADDYDSRFYVQPGAGFLDTDSIRGEDDGPSYSLAVGLPLSAKRSLEFELGYGDLDSTELYSAAFNLLTHFNPDSPALYSITSLGYLRAEGGPGEEYDSAILAGGLGYAPGWAWGLRLEGLIRADLHFNQDAGLGGKDIFVEPLVRLAYRIPLGAKPVPAEPAASDVAVVDMGADSDGDGVADDADLCPGTPASTVVDETGCAPTLQTSGVGVPPADCREPAIDEAVDEYGCAVDRAVILNGVNFEFDSAVLTAEAESILDDVAQVLMGMPDTPVEIAGHTSDEGDEFYNIDLSQRRAASVKAYLKDAGVNADRLTAKGYGAQAPLADNDTIDGRRNNRRVEVKVIR